MVDLKVDKLGLELNVTGVGRNDVDLAGIDLDPNVVVSILIEVNDSVGVSSSLLGSDPVAELNCPTEIGTIDSEESSKFVIVVIAPALETKVVESLPGKSVTPKGVSKLPAVDDEEDVTDEFVDCLIAELFGVTEIISTEVSIVVGGGFIGVVAEAPSDIRGFAPAGEIVVAAAEAPVVVEVTTVDDPSVPGVPVVDDPLFPPDVLFA